MSQDKSENDFRKGGPPKVPPRLRGPVRVYFANEEVKIDKYGRHYSGISLEELEQYEQSNKAQESSLIANSIFVPDNQNNQSEIKSDDMNLNNSDNKNSCP